MDGSCADIYRGYFVFRVSQGAELYRPMRSADSRARARGGFIDVYSVEVTLTSIPGGRVDRVISQYK